jgi:hypothetical protein
VRSLLPLLLLIVVGAACGAKTTAHTTTVAPRPTPAFTQAVVSSNWSGYVARRTQGGGFDRASGSWTMPAISCATGDGSSAAFWVGIGGWGRSSPSLEQLGASGDCTPSGAPSLRLWTEIVPAPPIFLPLRLAPGDHVTATVSVAKGSVTFDLRNATRGTHYTHTTRERRALDVATAEWIAEAPSLCRTISECEVVPLSDFGTVRFTNVLASGSGVSGPLGAPTWRVTPVALIGSTGSSRYIAATNPFGAVPQPPAPGGRAFTIAFRRSLGGAVPARPLPGAPLPAWIR